MSAIFFLGRARDGVWIAHRRRRVLFLLQCRVLFYGTAFFSSAHTRPCVDWRPASAWNADAGSVRAANGSPAKSRFVPEFGCCRFAPIRAARSRCTLGRASFLGVPGPEPNADACKDKVFRWALFSGTLNRMQAIEMCALRLLGMYMRSSSWIGIGIGIGTRSYAGIGG
jgi:hypothetical protein